MQNRKTYIICGRSEIHGDQALVERFNRTLAECLFGRECASEMILPSEQWSIAWVKRPLNFVRALSNKVTHLTSKTPAVAIKMKGVVEKPSTPYSRPISVKEKKLPCNANVRYLYQPGDLEGWTVLSADTQQFRSGTVDSLRYASLKFLLYCSYAYPSPFSSLT